MRRALGAITEKQRQRLFGEAQRTAASRSPSRRPSRASSPARSDASDFSYSGAWRRDPTSMSYGGWYHNNTRVVEVTENTAGPVKQHLARASSPSCSAASANDAYSCDPVGIAYRHYCNHNIGGVEGKTEVMQAGSDPAVYCCSMAPMGTLQLPPHIRGVHPSTVPTSKHAGLPC